MYPSPREGSGKPSKRFMTPKTLIPLSAFVLLALMAAYYFSPFNILNNAQAAELTTLPGQRPNIVKNSQVLNAVDPNTQITLAIGLRMRNQSGLDQYVKSISQAKKGRLKRTLTPAQIIRAYAPLPSSEQAIISYMQQYGLKVTSTSPYHTVIGFSGTIGQAESALHTQVTNYRAASGQTYYAPSSDPNVPATIAPFIQSVSGLDDAIHYTHPPITQKIQPLKTKSAAVVSNSANPCTTPSQAGGNYYDPTQIANAYNLTGLHNQGFYGKGQTVALVEFSDYINSDISTYISACGLHTGTISRIVLAGGPKTSTGATDFSGAVEVDIDSELVASTAPQANQRIYVAPGTDAGNLLMWQQIVNDAVPVVSSSWSGCESLQTSGIIQTEGNLFQIAAAQGQTVFNSSGDSGSEACYQLDNTNKSISVNDPASQPYVTGVGGTSLLMNGNSYISETAWGDSYGAGGGGYSTSWPLPTWQQGSGISGTAREVPDVSLSADPQYGYPIYCTASNCTYHWGVWSGTSAAAPMWAAMTALANQKSLSQGGYNLGFINPMLYQIYQNSSQYSSDFHDITAGNNGINGATQYSAGTGYDLATGLGSYNAANLANDLISINKASTGTLSTPANKTWYFAEGSVGGSFSEFITVLNPGASTATVTVTYLFENKPSQPVTHTVNANSRYTISANTDLNVGKTAPQESIAAIVTSDVPVVAERPMYFDLFNVPSGTDVLGATQTQTSYYFAEGDARKNSTQSYATFVTMLNPSTTQTANVTVTYYANGQPTQPQTLKIGPMQRGTTSPASAGITGQVAFKVTSDIGIVAERPMYFHDNVPNAGGVVTGAASAVGATAPGGDWLFAEGHTGDSIQEYVVLANFSATDTTASVKLEYTPTTNYPTNTQTVSVPVPAYSQVYVDVNHYHDFPAATCQPSGDVSIEVTDPSSSIVAERMEYFHFGKQKLSGGTDVVGQPGSVKQTDYSFAEGYTGSNFYEYITLQNPTSQTAQVVVTIYADQTIMQQAYQLAPYSRKTVDINGIEVPLANAYPGNGANDVSIDVHAVSGAVVAERPMFFKFGVSTGGTDVIGYTGN